MIRTYRPRRLLAATTLLAATAVAPACDTDPITVVAEVDETWGFESGAGGWTELARPGSGGTAAAAVSSQGASEGSASMRLSLDDPTGGGAVYVTRRFADLAEGRAYDVEVSFDLGSEDTEPASAWSLRAGAGPDQPGGSSTFPSVGSTAVAGTGLTFERREAELGATTGASGELWVTVGVAQGGAGDRDYYLDRLRVVLRRR